MDLPDAVSNELGPLMDATPPAWRAATADEIRAAADMILSDDADAHPLARLIDPALSVEERVELIRQVTEGLQADPAEHETTEHDVDMAEYEASLEEGLRESPMTPLERKKLLASQRKPRPKAETKPKPKPKAKPKQKK